MMPVVETRTRDRSDDIYIRKLRVVSWEFSFLVRIGDRCNYFFGSLLWFRIKDTEGIVCSGRGEFLSLN
jgi:hypothetical protein